MEFPSVTIIKQTKSSLGLGGEDFLVSYFRCKSFTEGSQGRNLKAGLLAGLLIAQD